VNQRDNQQHWTVPLDEFVDRVLLGKPNPAWME
jgi:hypothetical protein